MRQRAPGGGRKPLKPADRNSEILNVRVRPDVRRDLYRLAAKRKPSRTLSREIQHALNFWIERHHARPLHIEALSVIAVRFGQFFEALTGKRWIDDPFTAQGIIAALNQLIRFLDLGRVAKTPPDLKNLEIVASFAAGELITGLALMEEPEDFAGPRIKSMKGGADFITDDFEALRRLYRNLGSRKRILRRFIEGIEGEK